VTSTNPFIRHIVLRTRDYLETTHDPETGEPYLKPVRVNLFGERDLDAIQLPPFLQEAYAHAEAFCRLLGQRVHAGFFRTLLLRRVGSTMEAGRLTAEKILNEWIDLDQEDEDDEDPPSAFGALTLCEREALERFLKALEADRERDPKYAIVRELLLKDRWLELGCIIFSQYFDSVWWLAARLSSDMPNEEIGIYAGAAKSGVIKGGVFKRTAREDLKAQVRKGDLRLILGTDAASEGLNL
jgi:hypothetical protein